MLREPNPILKALRPILKKVQSEDRLLNAVEILEVLESLKVVCHSPKYLDTMILCIKTLLDNDLNIKQSLTKREIDIVLRIGNGQNTNQIAKSLNLSKLTVESHRKNIRKKFKHITNFDLSTFCIIYSIQHKYLR